jgi:hypothetical protein
MTMTVDRPNTPGTTHQRAVVGRRRSAGADPHDRDGAVKSVLAALDVLECFASDDELGVSDIARRLGVAKSTAHRLLTSLRSRGLAHFSREFFTEPKAVVMQITP